MIAGQLEIQLLANMARLQADMTAAKNSVTGAMTTIERSVESAKRALGGLALVGVGLAFAEQVKAAIELADQLNKLSQRTGLSAESLSQWQYAAKLSDVSVDSFNTAIKKLNVSIAEGLAGDKQKVAMFQAIGISQNDLGKGTEAVMMQMANAFAVSNDDFGKATVAMKLMGKAGDEMVPLLNGGEKSVRALKAEAEKLGLTISTSFAKQAEEFNDNLTRLNASSKQLTIALGSDLVSGLGRAAKAMADAAIEGGKLAGVIAGFRTLMTGDDLHKANVEMVESADAILSIQKTMEQINAKGAGKSPQDNVALANLQKELDRQQEIYTRASNYQKLLMGEQAKSDADTKAAEDARRNGKKIRIPGEANTAYEELDKAIQKRAALAQQQLDYGDKLPESMKYEIEAVNDLQAAYTKQGSTITTAMAVELESRIHNTAEIMRTIELRNSEYQNAKEIAEFRQKTRAEEYASGQALYVQSMEINSAQHKAAEQTLKDLQFEAEALTMTTRDREIAVAMRQLEQQGIKEGTQAYADYADAIRASITASDERRRSQSIGVADAIKAYHEEMTYGGDAARDSALRSIHSIEDALVQMASTGKLDVRSLVNTMISEFYRLQIVRPFLANLMGNGSGLGLSVGNLVGSIGSIFGGGVGGVYGPDNIDVGGGWSPARADGGPVNSGMSYLVGERGPELFVPHESGSIISNGGGGQITFAPVINIDSRTDQAQVHGLVMSAIQQSQASLVETLQRQGRLQ